MADDLVVRAQEALALRAKATQGSWGIESCGSKGDGSNMVGVLFDTDDINCERPLSGWVPECRPLTNEFIEYYVDETVAECAHRNRNSGFDAEFIAHAGNHYAEIARAYLAVVAERDAERATRVALVQDELRALRDERDVALAQLAAMTAERDALSNALREICAMCARALTPRTPDGGDTLHASDCAVHNEPASPNGPCDCGAEPGKAGA